MVIILALISWCVFINDKKHRDNFIFGELRELKDKEDNKIMIDAYETEREIRRRFKEITGCSMRSFGGNRNDNIYFIYPNQCYVECIDKNFALSDMANKICFGRYNDKVEIDNILNEHVSIIVEKFDESKREYEKTIN